MCYTCMCISLSIYLSLYIYIYIYNTTYILTSRTDYVSHLHMLDHTITHTHTCRSLSLSLPLYVYLYTYMFICMYIHIYIYTYRCVYIYIYIHACNDTLNNYTYLSAFLAFSSIICEYSYIIYTCNVYTHTHNTVPTIYN